MQPIRKQSTYIYCILSTFVLGFFAHAFTFFNFNISHDSLDDFAGNNIAKIAIGRFLTPFIQTIFGQNFITPWLIGVVSLLLIGIATCFIIKIFDIKNKYQIILLSGILATNLSIATTAATYQEDLIVNSCAFLFSCIAAYFWSLITSKKYLKYSLLSTLFIILQLGCYQSYISVTLVIIIIKSIKDILNRKSFNDFFTKGILGIIISVTACLLYFGLSNVICLISNIPVNSNNYNSLSTVWTTQSSILSKIVKTYSHVLWNLFAPTYATDLDFLLIQPISSQNFLAYIKSGINIFLLIFTIITIIKHSNSVDKKSKITLVLLIIVAPFAMNLSHLLSGTSHELMYFSFYLYYLFIFVVSNTLEPNNSFAKKILIVSVSIIIFCNISISNRIYTKKQIDTDSTNFFMNRLVTKIEGQPAYKYGETPIYIIGTPKLDTQEPYADLKNITGLWTSSSITREELYPDYFQYILNYKINLITDPEQQSYYDQSDIVQNMPTYPNSDSIQNVNGTIVIKLSERSS